MRPAEDPLAILRSVFLSFCAALGWLIVVVLILGDVTDGSEPVAISVCVVVASGLISQFAPGVFESPLDCASSGALAASYGGRFFLRLAFAVAAVLTGFSIGLSLGPWWVFFIGAFAGVVAMGRAAPSRRNLERDQRLEVPRSDGRGWFGDYAAFAVS